MAFPDALIPKLGRVPDRVLAEEAGVSEQAVAKQRQKRGIAPWSKAAKYAKPSWRDRAPPGAGERDGDPDGDPPRIDLGSSRATELERIPFLEQHLRGLLELVEAGGPGTPGASSLMKQARDTHAELERERKAVRPPPERMSPEELVAEHRRESPNWPDQILEVHVDTYCDRNGFVVVPKALQAV